MKIITEESLKSLIRKHGFNNFMQDLMKVLSFDFKRWDVFTKMPRPCMHVPGGVMELMPICDNKKYYAFKFVNCHPKNPSEGKLTVVATGQLCEIKSGYPLMFSEMTVLTALRTAATLALATNLMARKNVETVAIIGTGAQSEFQIKGLQLVRNFKEVRYFDTDSIAMDKFEKNMKQSKLKLIRCMNAKEAVMGSDIVTIITACKAYVEVVKNSWIVDGVHINALGGDTIGKTELEKNILPRSKVVVEYFEQSFIEGEIQKFSKKEAQKIVFAEMYELVKGIKKGRANDKEITLFDSVGIALEDYSVLRLVYELALKYKVGEDLNFVPKLKDPKNLISTLI